MIVGILDYINNEFGPFTTEVLADDDNKTLVKTKIPVTCTIRGKSETTNIDISIKVNPWYICVGSNMMELVDPKSLERDNILGMVVAELVLAKKLTYNASNYGHPLNGSLITIGSRTIRINTEIAVKMERVTINPETGSVEPFKTL